jgi:hypothetical protein
LIGNDADGSLIVSFAAPEPGGPVETDAPVPGPGLRPPVVAAAAGPPAGARWVDVVEEVEDGRVCVEVRWGSSRLADISG